MQLLFDLSGPSGPAEAAETPAEPCPALSLKAKIARIERSNPLADWGVAPFGDPRLDGCFPGGGLPRGRWHEIAGDRLEREAPAASAAFAARLGAHVAKSGVIVWALQRDDAHAPGLMDFGLDANRLIFVRANNDADVLAVCEDALRTRGVDAVIGETGALSLIAGKRLQLACERGGASAFMLRRRLYGAPRHAPREEASTSATRWRIAPAPSESDMPGLGETRWRAALERCRNGRTGAWILENDNATRTVRVAAELADHTLEAAAGESVRPGRARSGAGAAASQYAGAVRHR